MQRKPTYEELVSRVNELERDALEHQKTKDQLRRNEGLFRDLVEKLPIPVAIATSEMNTLYINPKFSEVFGYTAEDIPNQQVWQQKFFINQKYRNKIAREVNQWIESGAESTIFKRKYTDKWLQEHDVIVHIFRIKNRYYLFIEDITDLKRSEEDHKKDYSAMEQRVAERTDELTRINLKLKQEIEERKRVEEKLRFTQFAVDHASDAAFWLDSGGNFTYVNDAACRTLGYSKDELVGMTVHDIDPEFPQEIWPDHWENVKRKGSAIIESNHRTRENRVFPVEISVNYIEFDGKEYNCAFARNISERKQAEDALRESEGRYRILFEQTPDAIFVDNKADETVDANPAACKLMGYSRDELLKLTIADRQAPEVRGSKGRIMSSEIEKHGGIAFEGLNIRKDGTLVPVEIRTASLTAEGLYLSIVRDITSRKQAEEEKQKIQAQLQQIQKMEALSTLAGGLAHRFNNTLSVIAGNIELIKMEFPENEIINNYTDPVRESIHHLVQLTDQMLAYARGGKYKAKTISLSNFVRNTLPLLTHIVKPRVVVETDLPFDIKSVEADLTQMQMVLSALLQNASEAIKDRGRIRLICSNEDIVPDHAANFPGLIPGPYVCLSIRDDGKGMDEETRSRAFEPFFSTKFQGRGLGLAATYGIIKNHNGYIYIESGSGEGTAVKIYLPAKSGEEIPQIRKKEIVRGSSTILLIEDEEPVLAVNRAMLEKLGYQVISAETGQKAIDIARTFEGKIDIALLDIVLPDMNGKEVYSIISASRPEMKIVVCSGYSLEGPVQEIISAGAHSFIQKPFSLKSLSESLNAVMSHKENDSQS